MNYRKLSKELDLNIICDLWNKEIGDLFPITEELMIRNISNAYIDASYVAYENNIIKGFIIGKIWQSNFYIESYDKTAWISLIYVEPNYRNKGIGTKLLELAETEFERLNKSIIHIGKDYNDFFPGLPFELDNSLDWFIKRGYKWPCDTHDLLNKNKDKINLINTDIVFRQASLVDKENILAFLKRNWPGRWLKEAIDYFDNGGTGREFLIGLDNEKVIAFVKTSFPDTEEKLTGNSLTWRAYFKSLGGLGPLGVDKDYRGRHLGFDIVAFGKNTLIDANVSNILIDWTGLIDFYSQFGFEKWRSYHYLQKTKN